MLTYVARRLLESVPVLFLTSVGVFLFIRAIPGDPAVTMAGLHATPDQVDALRHRFGLDQPLVVQYLTWLARLAGGDLGTTYTSGQPIGSLILQRIPATVHLALGATLVTLLIGGPLGVFVAVRPRHPLTRLVTLLNAIALATPTFWLGLLLLLFFAVDLHWLPTSSFVSVTVNPVESVRRLILPSLTLGAYSTAVLIRFLKSSIANVMGSDFIRTAYAKGLDERIVVGRHALKVALPPVVTIMAIQFSYLLGGAVITEDIFGWPGVGRLMLDAIQNQDYLVIQSTMLLFVATFVTANVVADVGHALLDPRIRFGR